MTRSKETSLGSARRRKLEAALEKTKKDLAVTRAERDLLSSTLHDLHEHDHVDEVWDDVDHDHDNAGRGSAARLAARVSELRDVLAVLAPQTEEDQRRAAEAVEGVRRAGERTEALERQLGAAHQREGHLTEQGVRDRAAISDLEARVAEFEGIEARIAQFDEERRDAEATAGEAERFRSRLEDLETRVQTEADRSAELEAELGTARARLQELESGRETAEQRLGELTEAAELAQTQRETALVALEERLNDLQRMRAHVAEARSTSEAAERQLAELSEALEVAESERDAARAALEARVGDVHRLRDKVAELQAGPDALEGGDAPSEIDDTHPEGPIPIDPGGPEDSIELRIARVQERLEQTELRMRRALTTAEAGGPTVSLEEGSAVIVDITGHDARLELGRLREEVTLLAERATSADAARRRAEEELAAVRGQGSPVLPQADPFPEAPPPGNA
jgi:chromosome segregation ATPase